MSNLRSGSQSSFNGNSSFSSGSGGSSGTVGLQLYNLEELYGREKEQNQLQKWFQDGTSNLTLIVISGKEGVGKTSFILSLQEQWKMKKMKMKEKQEEEEEELLFAMGSFPQGGGGGRGGEHDPHQATTSRTSTATATTGPPLGAIKDAIIELIQQWSATPYAKEEMIDFANQPQQPENIQLLQQAVPHLCDSFGIGIGTSSSTSSQQPSTSTGRTSTGRSSTSNSNNMGNNNNKYQQQPQQQRQSISTKSLFKRSFASSFSTTAGNSSFSNLRSSSLSSSSTSWFMTSRKSNSTASTEEDPTVTETNSNHPTRTPPPPLQLLHTIDINGCTLHSFKVSIRQLLIYLCGTSSSQQTQQQQRRPRRRIVLVLDNFHNVDSESLSVIEFLISCQKNNLLPGLVIIVSYRNHDHHYDHDHHDETTTVPPFLMTLQSIEQQQQEESTTTTHIIHRLVLDNLTVNDVTRLLSTVTERRNIQNNDDIDGILPLSEIIHSKTYGNPYHILQFIQYLVEEGHLQYSLLSYRWEWDTTNIQHISSTLKVATNVSEWLASSLLQRTTTIPSNTRYALLIVSCFKESIPYNIIYQFFYELQQLRLMKQKDQKDDDDHHPNEEPWLQLDPLLFPLDPKELQSSLDVAVKVGILNHASQSSSNLYTWSHEQLQLVAYNMIDDDNDDEHDESKSSSGGDITSSIRGPIHSRLGKILWQFSLENHSDSDSHDSDSHDSKTTASNRKEQREWMIYLAADQFNKASQYFTTNCVCIELATLNLQAAKLSIAKSAFYPAREMLRTGIQRLDAQTLWQDDYYELSLDLYSSLAEIEFALGNEEAAVEEAVQQVFRHGKSLTDKFRARVIYIQSMANGKDRNYKAGVERCIAALAEYGIHILYRPCVTTLAMENRKLKQATNGQLESILDLEPMTDPTAQQVSRFLLMLSKFSAMSALTSGNPNLSQLASARSLRLFYEYGVTPDTCLALLTHSTVLKHQGKFKKCYGHADIVEQLCARFKEEPGSVHSKVKTWLNSSIYPTLRPFHKSLDPLLDGYKIGLRTGDMESASIGAMCYAFCYICIGLPLTPLESDVRSFGQEARQFGRAPSLVVVFDIVQQTISNLQGDASQDPTLLTGDVMDQDEVLRSMEGHARSMTLRDVRTFQLLLACIYGDFTTARKLVDQLSSYSFTDPMVMRRHIRLMYLGLAAVAIGQERGWCKKCKYGKLGKKIIKLFHAETEMGSVNAHPILQMLQAEEKPSKELYDKAIKSCGRSGLIQHQAYMYERAGLHLMLIEKDEGGAEFYLTQASLLYNDWGAFGKVEQMKDRYSFLTSGASSTAGSSSGGGGAPMNSSLKGRSRHEKGLADSLKTFAVIDTSKTTDPAVA